MVIGVTGLIGSGKSEVSAVFCEMGARLIDCDQIGREVVENDGDVLERLADNFGQSILTPAKTLDRRQLGLLAFANPGNTEMLNSIVHPALLKELDNRISDARKNNYHAVVDAALLIFWGYEKNVDYTVLVSSHSKNRIRRLLSAGMSEKEIKQRTESQLSLSDLREKADKVISNNDTIEDLRKKAKILYLELTKREIG